MRHWRRKDFDFFDFDSIKMHAKTLKKHTQDFTLHVPQGRRGGKLR